MGSQRSQTQLAIKHQQQAHKEISVLTTQKIGGWLLDCFLIVFLSKTCLFVSCTPCTDILPGPFVLQGANMMIFHVPRCWRGVHVLLVRLLNASMSRGSVSCTFDIISCGNQKVNLDYFIFVIKISLNDCLYLSFLNILEWIPNYALNS